MKFLAVCDQLEAHLTAATDTRRALLTTFSPTEQSNNVWLPEPTLNQP